jgi:chitinase
MMNIQMKEICLLFILIGVNMIDSQSCPDTKMCRSQWGYCGTGSEYCGNGCSAGPCSSNNNGGSGNGNTNSNGNIITDQMFSCAFNTIDAGTRANRLSGLRQSGWNPTNKDEAAVFLAHVFHETDGLKTVREYCAPGCGSHYAGSWCSIQGKAGKLYYGRGWFQLSWPCNYYAAGQSLGVDLLSNPDLVEQRQDLAVKTAIWFYNTNNMANPARQGDFAATTKIINGQLECNGGPGANNQKQRVNTYKRIRNCFGLGEPKKNPTC